MNQDSNAVLVNYYYLIVFIYLVFLLRHLLDCALDLRILFIYRFSYLLVLVHRQQVLGVLTLIRLPGKIKNVKVNQGFLLRLDTDSCFTKLCFIYSFGKMFISLTLYQHL